MSCYIHSKYHSTKYTYVVHSSPPFQLVNHLYLDLDNDKESRKRLGWLDRSVASEIQLRVRTSVVTGTYRSTIEY